MCQRCFQSSRQFHQRRGGGSCFLLLLRANPHQAPSPVPWSTRLRLLDVQGESFSIGPHGSLKGHHAPTALASRWGAGTILNATSPSPPGQAWLTREEQPSPLPLGSWGLPPHACLDINSARTGQSKHARAGVDKRTATVTSGPTPPSSCHGRALVPGLDSAPLGGPPHPR